MRKHTRLRSLFLISAAFATLAASAFAKPKVVIVSMGGSISS